MRGQWIGAYNGSIESESSNGSIIVNVDELETHYEIVVYISSYDASLPLSCALITTRNKDKQQNVQADIYIVSPENYNLAKWRDVKSNYPPDFSHSETAKVNITFTNDRLEISAVTDIGFRLETKLGKQKRQNHSSIKGEVKDWGEFKRDISKLSKSKWLFRGQQKPWPLRTSLFRHKRFNIAKFLSQDVIQIHRRLCASTEHYFYLDHSSQLGAFINLLQHHGYPTPLLDWSYSPYVAAFFALRYFPKNERNDDLARIYLFNYADWRRDVRQFNHLNPPHLNFSVMEFEAINNPRHIPQQAITTISNVDDIESYIRSFEQSSSKNYLKAIDIPYSDRNRALSDLKFMGITAGSMFPSIDGVCEEFREVNF